MPLAAGRFISRCLGLATVGLVGWAVLPSITRADEPAKPGEVKPEAARGDAPRPAGDPSVYLKSMRDRLNDLGLTDDQKTKLDAIFAKAGEQLQKVMAEAKDLAPDERGQKMREVFTSLREELVGMLTPQQAAKAKEALSRPAAGRPGAGIDGLMQNLQKLDLTDDQKAKVKTLLDETKKAMEDLRAEAQNGGDRAAFREKAQKISQDVRTHLMEILTPEQATKLRETMQAGRPGPDGGGERKPADPKPADPAK